MFCISSSVYTRRQQERQASLAPLRSTSDCGYIRLHREGLTGKPTATPL
jgi:hypothetical protein